jgi:hypothetical protein
MLGLFRKKYVMYYYLIIPIIKCRTSRKNKVSFEHIGSEVTCKIFELVNDLSSIQFINKYCRLQANKIYQKEKVYVESSIYYPYKVYFYTLSEYKNKQSRFLTFDPNNNDYNNFKQFGFLTTRQALSKKLKIKV